MANRQSAWATAAKLYPSPRHRFQVSVADVPGAYWVVHIYDWEDGRFVASIFGERSP